MQNCLKKMELSKKLGLSTRLMNSQSMFNVFCNEKYLSIYIVKSANNLY
jgi:hypothetical protein